MKVLSWAAGLSGLIGVAFASLAAYAALEHNPQGEFRNLETGVLQWDSLTPLFLTWAIAIAVVAFTVFGGSWLLWRGFQRVRRRF